MSGLGGLNKSPNGVVIGLVQLQLPNVVTPADLKAQAERVAALVHGDFMQFNPAGISTASWIAFAYLVSVGSLVGFSAFVWLMKHSTPALVSTYAYVNPIVAVFLGWLVLGESIGPRTLVASAIIVTAVAIITAQRSRQAGT